MSAAQIDDAAATQPEANAPGHLPGFVELLARQTAGAADGTSQPIKQCVAAKPFEIPNGQAAAR